MYVSGMIGASSLSCCSILRRQLPIWSEVTHSLSFIEE
jgi:hypothetical protein